MATDLTRLTPRRQRFIGLYLIYGHERGGPMRAFEEAGYKVEGSNHPDIQLSKLMRHPDVAAAIAAGQGAMAEKFAITQERVLRELALIAFSDIMHYRQDDTGQLEVNPDADINPAVTRAVSSVEYTTTTEGDRTTRKMKLKLWDKGAALTLLMKHLGMLVDRSINLNMDAKMTMEAARKVISTAHSPTTADEFDFAWQKALASSPNDLAEAPHDNEQVLETSREIS